MRSIYGLGAMMALASLHVASPRFDAPEPRRKKEETPEFFRLAPQSGPVIDSTRESKRARRRRLAREQGGENG